MASVFPAPPLMAPRSPFASQRSYDTSTSGATISTAATPSSMRTSASGRKRARNESPTRDWQDLGSSTGSLWGAGGPSPGFFNEPMDTPVVLSPGVASPGFFSSASMASPSFASPAPLTHSRYQLAGGQATPSIAQSAASDFFALSSPSLGNSVSDLGYRRGRPYHDERSRSASGFSIGLAASSERLPTALSRESNGRPRALPSTDTLAQSTLTSSVLQTVSGVFGAVWNFCTAGSFTGFFAGGGKGYTMDGPGPGDAADEFTDAMQHIEPLPTASIWQDVDVDRDMSISSHLPGGFPDIPPSPSSARVAKKAKHAHFHDDAARSGGGASCSSLTQSWIVVRDGSPAVRRKTGASTASPASMRQASASASSSAATRPTFRRGSGAALLAKPSPHRTASAAGLRSPTRSPTHSRHSSNVVERLGGSGTGAGAGTGPVAAAAAAAADRPIAEPEEQHEEKSESPIVAETARFVKDMRRRERREDRDIKRMNRALEDMIREAREALGTTVEVDMLGEGREEDRW